MPPERVLFVHAHPDDESITTGGTLALLAGAGTPVTVLTCTRGECGEVIPLELQHLLGDEDALAAHRETEIAEAMRQLGVTDHRFLGTPDARMVDRQPRRYRDSGMVWGASGPELRHPLSDDALCAAEPGEVAADIATVIATTRATAVVSYDETGGYGHPDHIAAHDAALHAAIVMGVPFFAIQPADVGQSGADDVRVDVTPVLERKMAALRAHRSQLSVEEGRMTQPGGQVEPITTIETFRRVDVDAPRTVTWADLTLGSRLLACAIALVVGGSVGALATVTHQAQIRVGEVNVPGGLIVGLVVVAALLAGFRILSETRTVCGFAAIGVLGTIGILSLESTGGSVLIPDSPLSYYWLYGPAIITALVLAWPKLERRGRDKIETPHQPKGSPAP